MVYLTSIIADSNKEVYQIKLRQSIMNCTPSEKHFYHIRNACEADRHSAAEHGFKNENIGNYFDEIENISRRIPLSNTARPSYIIIIGDFFANFHSNSGTKNGHFKIFPKGNAI